MKKSIEVEGKMMDAVEFSRFIRQRTAPEIEKMVKEVIETEHRNTERLRKLQESA